MEEGISVTDETIVSVDTGRRAWALVNREVPEFRLWKKRMAAVMVTPANPIKNHLFTLQAIPPDEDDGGGSCPVIFSHTAGDGCLVSFPSPEENNSSILWLP